MAEFSREELKSLVSEQIPPCVSIYMPSDQPGTLTPLNSIRFKTLLNQAEEQLRSLETDKDDIQAMLSPAHDLLKDQGFWQQQREGLAVFLSASPQAFRYYADNSAAINFPEMVKIADQFQFKPLLPLLFSDGSFYILALSRHHVGLLRATRDTVRSVELAGVPHSIVEEVPAAQSQGHATIPGGYDPKEYDKDQVLRYFHEVDHGLHHIISNGSVPLVLAGLEYLHPLYQEANTYPHLIEEGIRIDAQNLSAEELHKMAWSLVEPSFRQAREAAVNRYRQVAQNGLASDKLADILAAAHYGRVDTLFVTEGAEEFGIYDAPNNRLEAHTESRPGNSDLLDAAATQTVLNGGTVYVVPQPDMPDPIGKANAIFRY